MTITPRTDPRLLTKPDDVDLPVRMQRLAELGFGLEPVVEFDKFAARLANAADAPYAMVNFVTPEQQFFAGLYAPSAAKVEALNAARSTSRAAMSRFMPRDFGYCPYVAAIKKARVFDDVCQYPRWGGNPVVNGIGVRSYIGAPLLDDKTGVALGTICAVSTETSNWGAEGLAMIKSMAAEVMDMIKNAERQRV